ncbi:diguanylate cyclase domain-containing protein [Catenuloplanes japonicus]|uniref:diguanylate cyclase domain-containing protein n=1 Tax=Catenuloplanes japonicus TaxID=33876 RepID=UPI00068F273A|nr:diguanylate cyclase [Catenuloplanes japonicus]
MELPHRHLAFNMLATVDAHECVTIAVRDPHLATLLRDALLEEELESTVNAEPSGTGPVILDADDFIDQETGVVAACREHARAGRPVIALGPRAHGLALLSQEGPSVYIAKPAHPAEIAARTASLMTRSRECRDSSPDTGLPGSRRLRSELERRLREHTDTALCLIDVDRFKAVHDVYDIARANAFICCLGTVLSETVTPGEKNPPFVAHIGGDDFAVICDPDRIRPLTQQIVLNFESRADKLYDKSDAQRGFVAVKNHHQHTMRAALVTLSIGISLSFGSRETLTLAQIIGTAVSMLKVAKNQPGSYVAIDRRPPPALPALANLTGS